MPTYLKCRGNRKFSPYWNSDGATNASKPRPARVANLIRRQAVEVHRATADITVKDGTVPPARTSSG